jgi:cellulose synthase/poly-beta-1,6-N-acetylglucosamine synthase-like glycosyltransferase
LLFINLTKNYNHNKHPVSVIVCSRDEDETWPATCRGYSYNNIPVPYEVVMVNDNSLDDSKYILQELKKTFKLLNVVELTHEAKLITGKKISIVDWD